MVATITTEEFGGIVAVAVSAAVTGHRWCGDDSFEPLILPDEAARCLGVPVTLLLRWARAGAVKSYRIGKLWRFRASELRDDETTALAQAYYLDRPGVCAFRAGDHFKIGRSFVSIRRRLSSLQTGQAHQLELLGIVSGDPEDEARVHRALAEFHVRGEWFMATEPALAALGALIANGVGEHS